MIESAELYSFLDDLERATSTGNVWDLLFTFVKNLDIDTLGYHHLPPPGATDFDEKLFLARGVPQERVSNFRRQHKFFRSPFEKRTSQINTPVFWSNAETQLDLSTEQIAGLKKFYNKDHYNGIIVPVFGVGGRNGCLVFHFRTVDYRISKTQVRHLQWASQNAHQIFCELMVKSRNTNMELTIREKEILTWVAHGKSNSVIGEIIGISPHTVNGHLRRIYLKTGTSDRTTASLRGIGECLIDY